MWYVYILESLVNNRHYTGYTKDLDRRLHEHNSGKTKYTSSTRPFKLIYKEEFDTRIEASKRERFLKSGKGRELIKEMGI